MIRNVSILQRPLVNLILNRSQSVLIKPSTNTSGDQSFLVEEQKGYAILKLNRPPINSLNSKFLTDLTHQIEKFEQNSEINGVILASNVGNVMSAGVDINALYPFDRERCAHFWKAVQQFWIKLYGSNKVYIAAINGHAIGAGCLLPMSCDYRIMATGPYKIGANETLLVNA